MEEGTNALYSTTVLLFQLSVIIVCAFLVDKVSKKISIPSVVGYIIIGVFLSPFVLGGIPFTSFFPHGIFPKGIEGGINVSRNLLDLSIIASVMLLFHSGLETDVNLFMRYALKGTIVGLGGVIASFFGGYYISTLFFPGLPPFHPSHLLMGTIATATSVGVTTSVLSSKRKISSPEGVTILSAAVFDDVIGIVILAIVIGISDVKTQVGAAPDMIKIFFIAIKSLGIWLGSTVIGILFARKLGRGLKKTIGDITSISIVVLGMAFFLGALFETWGLSMIIGAYVIGLTISNTDLSYVIQEKLSPILLLFVPIFFIVSGMQISVLEFLKPEIFLLGMGYSIMCMIAKFLGAGLPSLGLGFNVLGATRIGTGMAPRGEVALIIGSLGLSAGIINNTLYNAVMMMVIINALLAPFFLHILISLPKKGTYHPEKTNTEKTEIDFEHWQLARFIVSDFLILMEEEGFLTNKIGQSDRNIYHIRKDNMFFTLHSFNTGKLIFFSDKQSIPFFKTALYEAATDIAESAQIVKERVNQIAKNTLGIERDASQDASLENFISPFLVNMSIQAHSKNKVIEELASLLAKGGYLSDIKLLLKDIFEREETFSTGMQYGIAIPHARSQACKLPKIVIGLKKEGVDFDSFDKKPSHIFVLIAVPKEYPHLGILTQVNTFLQHEEFREQLLQCKKEIEVIELFMGSNYNKKKKL